MTLALLDWRRSIAELYRRVRAEADPAVGHQIWAEGRQALFANHPESASRAAVLRIPDYDPGWHFKLPVLGAEPLRIEVPTATDGVVPFERIGYVEVPGCGALDVWWLDSYGGGLWLPVRDTDADTYGGGRYLLDTVKGADLGSGADGTLIVDFNFAYNPSCAYDERWVCPLAPEGNGLPVPVPVGELVPA